MKKIIFLITVLFLSCASMDLRLDTLASHNDYGRIGPTISYKEFKYYTGVPDVEYVELARLIIQETPTVILSRSSKEMIRYMCKKAWENGADALINFSVSTTSVPGYARTTPVIKGTAVKFTSP